MDEFDRHRELYNSLDIYISNYHNFNRYFLLLFITSFTLLSHIIIPVFVSKYFEDKPGGVYFLMDIATFYCCFLSFIYTGLIGQDYIRVMMNNYKIMIDNIMHRG